MARTPSHDYQHPSTGYAHLGISHAVFHRWLAIGKARQSPPPFDNPGKLPEWYAGMQSAGAFTKALPAGVRRQLAAHLGSESAPATSGTPAAESAVERGAIFESLQKEGQYLREHIAYLRHERDAAYARGSKSEGNLHDERYLAAFDKMTTCAKRIIEIEMASGSMVSFSDVEQELGPRIAGVALGGMYLYPRVAPQLDAIIDAKERANAWKGIWREHCQSILTSRFVPDFIRNAEPADWLECAEWLEAKHKAR